MHDNTRNDDKQLQQKLLSLCKLGTMTSLDEIQSFLEKHGSRHRHFKVFHIGGTNGKGSVCAMITAVLSRQFDMKVGHIVSPHLVSVRERIQINNTYISHEDLLRLAEDISLKAEESGLVLGFFAFMTLISIWYFAEQEVDVCVYEVGAGGRFDATNLREKPVATAITSIGYDHAKLLGPTLEDIQRHKMGIMKKGVPCYTPLDNQMMHRGAHEAGADLHIVTQSAKTNLPGKHQSGNAGLVYEMLKGQGYEPSKIKNGLMQVIHPGRTQFITPWLLVDGAHNTQGVEALSDYVDSIRDTYDRVVTLFGTTKGWGDLFPLMDKLIEGDENWCTDPSYMKQRTATAATYAHFMSFEMEHAADLSKLLEKLAYEAKKQRLLVVVYGSLYLVGDVLGLKESGG